jgi:electron transfer flavoprotein alpha subunit
MSQPTKAPTPQPAGRAASKKELPEHFKAYKHVWVFVEQERGQIHPVSWELMGAGRKLADKLGVELAAAVLGPPGAATQHAAAEAFCYGADLVYLVADDLLTDYRNEPYTKALTDLVTPGRSPLSNHTRTRSRGSRGDDLTHRSHRRLHGPRR